MGGLGKMFLGVVVRHPSLAPEAVRLALATSASGWLGTFPFLPRPDPVYRDWRLATAYGSSETQPSATEVVEYLRWRRAIRKAR